MSNKINSYKDCKVGHTYKVLGYGSNHLMFVQDENENPLVFDIAFRIIDGDSFIPLVTGCFEVPKDSTFKVECIYRENNVYYGNISTEKISYPWACSSKDKKIVKIIQSSIQATGKSISNAEATFIANDIGIDTEEIAAMSKDLVISRLCVLLENYVPDQFTLYSRILYNEVRTLNLLAALYKNDKMHLTVDGSTDKIQIMYRGEAVCRLAKRLVK